jgi:Zn-dependent peptidase ImmA (M78 family)
MKIDRMELADIANPVAMATAVLKQLPAPVMPTPVEEIAGAVGIEAITSFNTTGFEGALITDLDKMSGTILYRHGAKEERRRFTIGHELGHYLNPWHVPEGDGFKCTAADMKAADASSAMGRPKWEVEANAFAAELLMPSTLFQSLLRKIKNLDLESIEKLAGQFRVSKIACARRVLAFDQEDCAVVLSKDGIVDQIYRSRQFPFISIRRGMELPPKSLSRTFSGSPGTCSTMDETEPSFWTNGAKRAQEFYEQVLIQSGGWRMTFLVCGECEEDDR